MSAVSAILNVLLAGMLLGLSSGLSPGPLLTLVVVETLRHGVQAGVRVALAPLLTDLPIILATVMLLRPLADQRLPLALLNCGGGLYLTWLGVQSLRFQGADLNPAVPAGALRRGVIANFLNPSPYLFWLTVGAPTVLESLREGWMVAAAFIIAFYTLLVGSKILLAVVLSRARYFLRSKAYVHLLRGLGLLLLVYAGLFWYDGWRLLRAALT